eukprot:TRINITY_DN43069_c0_g1_i1.p1 TRINITY_DN43069_c0_g1~~TRINITY_DN43069_c0_g1_i1.p1  ORF type:complete len:661 (+),score=181.86 TRINITY_DN43069_c0_g1_i1:52-1983(+)
MDAAANVCRVPSQGHTAGLQRTAIAAARYHQAGRRLLHLRHEAVLWLQDVNASLAAQRTGVTGAKALSTSLGIAAAATIWFPPTVPVAIGLGVSSGCVGATATVGSFIRSRMEEGKLQGLMQEDALALEELQMRAEVLRAEAIAAAAETGGDRDSIVERALLVANGSTAAAGLASGLASTITAQAAAGGGTAAAATSGTAAALHVVAASMSVVGAAVGVLDLVYTALTKCPTQESMYLALTALQSSLVKLSLLFASGGFLTDGDTVVYRVLADGLVAHTAPSTASDVCGSLHLGDRIGVVELVLAGSALWGRIGPTAWVPVQLCSNDCLAAPVPDRGEEHSPAKQVCFECVAPTVVVHRSPSLASEVSGTFTRGDAVVVLESADAGDMVWGRVGDRGWVLLSFVTSGGRTTEGPVPLRTAFLEPLPGPPSVYCLPDVDGKVGPMVTPGGRAALLRELAAHPVLGPLAAESQTLSCAQIRRVLDGAQAEADRAATDALQLRLAAGFRRLGRNDASTLAAAMAPNLSALSGVIAEEDAFRAASAHVGARYSPCDWREETDQECRLRRRAESMLQRHGRCSSVVARAVSTALLATGEGCSDEAALQIIAEHVGVPYQEDEWAVGRATPPLPSPPPATDNSLTIRLP